MSTHTDAPTPIGKYQAKVACRAGGFFRRAGEIFEMPILEEVPAHLEEIGEVSGAPINKAPANKTVKAPAKKATIPGEAQVNKSDIGAGKATAAEDVTSLDMVTK